MTNAVGPFRLALIRPGFAGPPSPPGEGDENAGWRYNGNFLTNVVQDSPLESNCP